MSLLKDAKANVFLCVVFAPWVVLAIDSKVVLLYPTCDVDMFHVQKTNINGSTLWVAEPPEDEVIW